MQETEPSATANAELPMVVVVAMLGVAVLAISSSAVLILWADAPAVSVTFWRTLGGALILAPAAIGSGRAANRSGVGRTKAGPTVSEAGPTMSPTMSQWAVMAVSGVALGIHFTTWLSSLELTSVAASVTLVATAPIFIAVILAVLGRPPGPATWAAIVVAMVGTAIITVGDGLVGGDGLLAGSGSSDDGPATGSTSDVVTAGDNPVLGDVLALVGAAAMAVYLMLGDRLRTSLSTAAYASRTYTFAAVSVLLYALVTDTRLVGFDTNTWLAIGAMVIGPQLAGHTALNYLLQRLGSVSVSLSLLLEPLGAATLVWLVFDELPPVTAVIGGPLVVLAVGLQVIVAHRTMKTDHPGRALDA